MTNATTTSGEIAGNPDITSELFPLNLIYDYPVRWSKFKVLRDFVQNFYDALGWKDWDSGFSYKLIDGSLHLIAKNVGFSYDWLLHIGASTKRESAGAYAGYFGEGFKIASLCAVRDHDWNVEIASRDWELKVVTTDLRLEGRDLRSLAYRIRRGVKHKGETVLRLSPFNDKTLLKSVLLGFYYPNNPLFGKKIWDSPDAAVYFRSNLDKPEDYPRTYNDDGQGIVFASYQALGSFQYPLIFCSHTFRYDDRDRSTFLRMDVVKLIQDVVSRLSPQASATVLRALRRRWYDRPRKNYDFDSWHGIIRTLVRNISLSTEQTRIWKEENPYLLVAQRVKRRDIPRYNRRRQALDWLKSSVERYRLVQEVFLALGYSTLEDACEQDGGFSVTREPDAAETTRIQLLEQLVQHLLPELFRQVDLPPCKIIKDKRAVWQGMASCIPMKGHCPVLRGLTVRYRLPHVALKQTLLYSPELGNPLSTYLHELAHMFGGDGSAAFSHALSELMEITLNNARLIADYQERWENLPELSNLEEKGS